jgi:predicted nucleic acid-binding protein
MEGALGNLQDDLESGVLHIPDLDFPAVFHRAESLSAAHTPLIGSRSLDILHVASALTLGCSRFASFDRRQRMLARKAGLRILPRALQGPGT